MTLFQRTKHLSTAHIVLILTCLAGGVLISSQWKVRPLRVVNPIQPYTSLTETRDALNEEQQRLKYQIANVTASLNERQEVLAKANHLDEGSVQAGTSAAAEAGLMAMKGQGVVITLDDSASNTENQAIAHAADLRDLVSLLRAVGSEAISINNERIIPLTSIDCIVNTILINDTRLSNPFVITVIGEKETIADVVNDPSILTDLHERVLSEGVVLTVEPKDEVEVPAYSGRLPGTYAKIKTS